MINSDLHNFIDKGNAKLLSSLLSLLVALSNPTFLKFSPYKLVTIYLCLVAFFHFCVECLLRILFACFVAFVHICVGCFSSKFELRPSNHAMSCVM